MNLWSPAQHDWTTWAWSIYVVGNLVALVHRENRYRSNESLTPGRAGDSVAGTGFVAWLNATASIATPAMFWPGWLVWRTMVRIWRIRHGRRLQRAGELFVHQSLARLAKRLRRRPDAFRPLLGAIDGDLVHLVDRLIAGPAVDGWVTTRYAGRRRAGINRATAPRDYLLGIALHLKFERTVKVNQCDESERNRLRRLIGRRIPLDAQNCSKHLAALITGLVHGRLDAQWHDDARRFLIARVPTHADSIERMFTRIARQQVDQPAAKAAPSR